MVNSLITHLQIFGVGFSFGMAGPCLLVCAPILITYVAGSKTGWADVFKDILVFLSGRLAAYIALGFLAGGVAGATLVQWVPDAVLKKIFGLILLLVGVKMFVFT